MVDANPIDANPIDHNPIDANPIDANPIDHNPIDANPIDHNPVSDIVRSALGACATALVMSCCMLQPTPATSDDLGPQARDEVPNPTSVEERRAVASAVPAPTAAKAAIDDRPDAATALKPLLSPTPLIELATSRRHPAVVSLPMGSTTARPVMVVAHGAGGRASIHCMRWRGAVGNRAFIVCPRGTAMYPYDPPHESGYYFDGHPKLAAEITAALAALVRTFGERVDLRNPVFVGYSQGANMGALILPEHDAHFASAVMWEGGVGEHREWNVRTAQRFNKRGGKRLVLACGRSECASAARQTAQYLERGGLETQLIYVAGAGHTYNGKLADKAMSALAWLVEGDGRWAADADENTPSAP